MNGWPHRVARFVRAAVLIAMVSGIASADPPKPANKKPTYSIQVERLPDEKPTTPSDRTPGVNGIDALGKVLVPDPHPDARLWPDGMLIVPPDIDDDNVLVPGSMQLPWRRKPKGPVSKELVDGLQDGLGAMIDLLLPTGS